MNCHYTECRRKGMRLHVSDGYVEVFYERSYRFVTCQHVVHSLQNALNNNKRLERSLSRAVGA